jgi:DNA mismatch endonuclease, patch repair protein
MSHVRGKDTKPEKAVRKIVHALGFRYRLHVKELPGTPDLVFSRLRSVVFVNSCFFHMHDCGAASIPKTRPEFWAQKLNRNVERDRANIERLQGLNWKVLTVWECDLKRPAELKMRIRRFLEGVSYGEE